MLTLSVSASVISCIVGIYASYYLKASTGGCIVLAQALLFMIVLVVAPRRGLIARVWSTQRRNAASSSGQQPSIA
jgi:ABC-type Mn2+/Zn2+ transport system permease subunit